MKPGYCAPEQRRDFREAALASDIYSFGCILHEVYDGTARVPYQQATSKVAMGVVIERCTELDPKKRFRGVDGLRDALVTVHATPSDVQAPPKAKEWVARIEAGQIMAAKSIDEPTAQRLVIEILASEAQANLIACAEVIGNTIDVYHAKISALLAKPKV